MNRPFALSMSRFACGRALLAPGADGEIMRIVSRSDAARQSERVVPALSA
jgi:hypothetical protein